MKIRKILTIIFIVLAAGMAALSGIMKLTASEEIVKMMSAIGVGKYVTMLGIMEIAFAALFVIPQTYKLGFILLSCYFAGALAVELSRAMEFHALLPLVLVWIAAFLRDSSIFLPAKTTQVA
ncbi:DoxX-like family protein [Chitinophaga jiangningensis]|uniref:DoxX-like family protein n=1 Tax=Chitinophaga jiangningensis TaxID=1419482 RepID=A0A1M7CNY2_9BACT|nr:DoxX family protein [Chitinophaga jiangningensis]SHL68915.1 DoxX-like family protein [Chitinophaga jiangningensis]